MSRPGSVATTASAAAFGSLAWWFGGFLALVAVVGAMVLLRGGWWFVGRSLQTSARRREDKFVEAMTSGDDSVKELRENWQKALAQFRSTGRKRDDFGYYVLIGEPGGGKSTTLRKSGLSFPIGDAKIAGISGTKNCDWWFTENNILLDTAGRLTFNQENPVDQQSWHAFLRLLREYRPHCPINGVIVSIPCNALLKDSYEECERKADVIRSALVELQHGLEVQFPVYVLLTKADYIKGFSPFFTHLRAMGQLQLLGWSRPNDRFKKPFDGEEVKGAFGELVARLRRCRLGLLEVDVEGGGRNAFDDLFAFPEELNALERSVQIYLERMLPETKLTDPTFLRGIYLTSGLNEGKNLMQACAELFGAKLASDEASFAAEERALFIRDFYTKKLFEERGLVVPTQRRLRRVRVMNFVGYGVVLALGGLGVALGVASALQDLHTVEIAKAAGDNNRPDKAKERGTFAKANADRVLADLRSLGALVKRNGGGVQLEGCIAEFLAHRALRWSGPVGPGVGTQQPEIGADLARAYRTICEQFVRELLRPVFASGPTTAIAMGEKPDLAFSILIARQFMIMAELLRQDESQDVAAGVNAVASILRQLPADDQSEEQRNEDLAQAVELINVLQKEMLDRKLTPVGPLRGPSLFPEALGTRQRFHVEFNRLVEDWRDVIRGPADEGGLERKVAWPGDRNAGRHAGLRLLVAHGRVMRALATLAKHEQASFGVDTMAGFETWKRRWKELFERADAEVKALESAERDLLATAPKGKDTIIEVLENVGTSGRPYLCAISGSEANPNDLPALQQALENLDRDWNVLVTDYRKAVDALPRSGNDARESGLLGSRYRASMAGRVELASLLLFDNRVALERFLGECEAERWHVSVRSKNCHGWTLAKFVGEVPKVPDKRDQNGNGQPGEASDQAADSESIRVATGKATHWVAVALLGDLRASPRFKKWLTIPEGRRETDWDQLPGLFEASGVLKHPLAFALLANRIDAECLQIPLWCSPVAFVAYVSRLQSLAALLDPAGGIFDEERKQRALVREEVVAALERAFALFADYWSRRYTEDLESRLKELEKTGVLDRQRALMEGFARREADLLSQAFDTLLAALATYESARTGVGAALGGKFGARKLDEIEDLRRLKPRVAAIAAAFAVMRKMEKGSDWAKELRQALAGESPLIGLGHERMHWFESAPEATDFEATAAQLRFVGTLRDLERLVSRTLLDAARRQIWLAWQTGIQGTVGFEVLLRLQAPDFASNHAFQSDALELLAQLNANVGEFKRRFGELIPELSRHSGSDLRPLGRELSILDTNLEFIFQNRREGETPALRRVWSATHVEEGKGDSMELYFLSTKPANQTPWHGLEALRHRRVTRGTPGRNVLEFMLSEDVMWLVSQKMLEDLPAGWPLHLGGGDREGRWKALAIQGPLPMLRFLNVFASQSAQARRSAEKSNTMVVRLGTSESAPRLVLSFYRSNVTGMDDAARVNQKLDVGAPLTRLETPSDL